MKGLIVSVAFLCIFLWGVLPLVDTNVTSNSILKNIDANVYIYTEIEIKNDWSVDDAILESLHTKERYKKTGKEI